MFRTKFKKSFLQTGSSMVQTFAGVFIDTGTRARTRKSLNALDDHMLKDMGISRGDIERIARQKVC
jgi:uncharacterized protein YjiS (DUF1127 family)